MHGAYGIVSPIRMFKLPIWTVEVDLHIEIYFETKFYIFLKFFTIFKRGDKLDGSEKFRLTNFVISLKNSKKFQKNVKFDLQEYFNMEIMFNGSDRSFEFFFMELAHLAPNLTWHPLPSHD